MGESATLDAATVKDVRDQVYSQPIETLNVAQSALFQADAMWPYFDRLRAGDIDRRSDALRARPT